MIQSTVKIQKPVLTETMKGEALVRGIQRL